MSFFLDRLVIIRDLYFMDPVFAPDKTDAVLIINSDAVLSLAIPDQRFEAIAWRHPQIIQGSGRMNHIELSSRNRCDARPSAAFPFPKELGGIVVFEALDHS
jgi:hypothetical protein